jgi:hypothetical protein
MYLYFYVTLIIFRFYKSALRNQLNIQNIKKKLNAEIIFSFVRVFTAYTTDKLCVVNWYVSIQYSRTVSDTADLKMKHFQIKFYTFI